MGFFEGLDVDNGGVGGKENGGMEIVGGVGLRDGFLDGFFDGWLEVGFREGFLLGVRVVGEKVSPSTVGDLLGLAEGMVGLLEGSLVGFVDGFLDGIFVGFLDGFLEGARVGFLEGALVGLSV